MKRRRYNIRAILLDPEQRQRFMRDACATLITVGDDFQITEADARKRAERLYPRSTA